MKSLKLAKAFTLMESGPVVFISTNDGHQSNLMTISWTMVMDFTPRFAITTGPWNHSFTALRKTRECVIAIPGADLIDTIVGVGTTTGKETDKFAQFGLTPARARHVSAPLVHECIANIECRVVDIIRKHNIVVLDGLQAWVNPDRKEQRVVHAVGDGTFIIDGRKIDRRRLMQSKIPPGV